MMVSQLLANIIERKIGILQDFFFTIDLQGFFLEKACLVYWQKWTQIDSLLFILMAPGDDLTEYSGHTNWLQKGYPNIII